MELFSFAESGPKAAGTRIIIAKGMSRTLWIRPGGLWKEGFFFPCNFFLPANLPWLYSEGASLLFQFFQQPGGGDIVALWLLSRALKEGPRGSATWHCVDRCLGGMVLRWFCGAGPAPVRGTAD